MRESGRGTVGSAGPCHGQLWEFLSELSQCRQEGGGEDGELPVEETKRM